jgi:chitodextrinase
MRGPAIERRRLRRRLIHAALLTAGVLTLPLLALWPVHAGVAGTSGWQWFKVDPHVHDVVSGDALADIGLISMAAKAHGYDAMFLTDHEGGSHFPIGTVIANHVEFDDSLGSKWNKDVSGTLSTSVNELVTTPVASGTYSEHLKSSSSTSGETFLDLKRGPNLRAGDLIFKVSIFPTSMGSDSALYVSVSLGGDPSVQTPEGYTTQGGVISPAKSIILVWQCGTARTQSTTDANAQVLVSTLPSCTANTWNDYTINITKGTASRNDSASVSVVGINSIAAGDLPVDYDPITWIKMSAAAKNGGTAEGYFDKLSLDASTPVPSGEEFAYRNTQIPQFNTATFKLFPSIEMGVNRHAQRFNFGITQASDYNSFFQCDSSSNNCKITNGTAGILPTQQTGYPAQLNHPNMPGGVKLSEVQADNYQAFGADVMEVRPDAGGVPPTTMVDIWDSMLQGGLVLIGTWSSDMHSVKTLDDSSRGVATYLYAPSLDFNALMRSLFEGRTYLGQNTFTGRVLFNLSSSHSEPYPARYPVYVSDAATSASVHLNITSGIASGSTVRWLANGSEIASEAASSSYDAVKSISLAGSRTYARAELHKGSPPLNYVAMTEPIFFVDVAGLPSEMSFHIDGIDTPNGDRYTKIFVKGITAASWAGASQLLSLTLDNPASSLTELEAATGSSVPSQVKVNGATVAAASSQSDFDSATDSSWFFDSAAKVVHLKAKQASGQTPVTISFATGTGDTTPPSQPGNFAANPVSPSEVDLGWSPSTDTGGSGVDHYDVYLGSMLKGTTTGTSFAVTALSCGTSYTFGVEAVDAVGNVSTRAATTASTLACTGGTTLTFDPVADAYVRSDQPTANFGTSTLLRADASPVIRSYLRFDASLSGQAVDKASLELSASSAGAGYTVHGGVSDNAWGETTINYSNAPGFGAGGPSVGSFASGAVTSIDVTSLVPAAGGLVTLVVDTASTTAMSFNSREATTATLHPRLVITTAGGGGADTTPPSPPTDVQASTVSQTQLDLSWTAASDNVGVDHYNVYANGVLKGTTTGTSFSVTGLTCGTGYTFEVETVDGAGNVSTARASTIGSTAACSSGGTTVTVGAAADAYVRSDLPTTNYGSSTALRVDTSPDTVSYLRFDLRGVTGTVTSATLNIYANSSLPTGYDVKTVLNNDTSWSETGMTYNNAPAADAYVATSTAAVGGSPTNVELTAFVQANEGQLVSIALTGRSTTALSLASRESVNPPQLVITTS